MRAADDIMSGKPIDAINSFELGSPIRAVDSVEFFTTGLVGIKR